MHPIRVASFFAGAGGLDLGFTQAGFDVVYASDIDQDCCQTLRMNRGTSTSKDSDIHCGDIRTIDFSALPKDIDLVVGGPPCQSFSASGRRAGGAAGRLDDRGNLFEAYRDIIGHLNPEAFVFENVRGILATNKGKDWSDIVAAFNELGYAVNFRLLDAADYGVPQHRERVFLVGHRSDNPFLFPRPLFGPDSKDKKPHVSPEQAFKHLKNDHNVGDLTLAGGRYSHLLASVPEGENYLFFTAKRGHPNPIFAYRSRFSDFLYKAHRKYPMKTIIASPGKYTGPLHWDNRYFSITEYMAIQGFPQGHLFFGDRASVIKQIGNSVSPKIAFRLAQAVADQIFGRPQDLEVLDVDRNLTFDSRKGAKAAITRDLHDKIQRKRSGIEIISTGEKKFSFSVKPSLPNAPVPNVVGFSRNGHHHLDVYFDKQTKLSAELVIDVWSTAREYSGLPAASLSLSLYGNGLLAPQLLWNAVDEWVRAVSSFGSLFELYGHFTEPHPFFQVSQFNIFQHDQILQFAKYVSNFNNCSRYLDKDDLLNDLSSAFGTSTFDELATQLRTMRYDVRTRETNIAIPFGKYMIAYPFTLPQLKQMNFAIKQSVNNRVSSSYVATKRAIS